MLNLELRHAATIYPAYIPAKTWQQHIQSLTLIKPLREIYSMRKQTCCYLSRFNHYLLVINVVAVFNFFYLSVR